MRFIDKTHKTAVFFVFSCLAAMSLFAQDAKLIVRENIPLDLNLAKQIAHACEAKAKELGVSVGIVILDEVGNLKLAYLMDGQSVTSLEWAKAKALSAYEFKQATNKGEFRVWNIGEKTMVLGVAGGQPLIKYADLVGAIGVSGTKGVSDDIIANAGLKEFKRIITE